MRSRESSNHTHALLAISLALFSVSSAWAGGKYKVLHAFTGGRGGGGLWGSMVLDTKGNLYGTTSGGGTKGSGTVFQLTPGSNGKWSETILHNFPSSADDGWAPTSSLALDAEDSLYGTAATGGEHHSGIAFELAHGTWAESVLYSFCAKPKCSDGGSPYAGLVMDESGNLFGTGGAAFELSPGSDGWSETVLHDFTCKNNYDGCEPFAGVVLDSVGNVYGTTQHGGGSQNCGGGCGTVYEVSPTPDGKRKESILHKFDVHPGDGAFPGVGALVLDSAGRLYGTTDVGGATGNGTIYRLTPQSGGHWKETILYSFKGGAVGQEPSAGVVMDKAGNLYGTTIAGGSACGCGVVYKLAPQADGKWKYTLLHTFVGSDGAQPDANLILDGKGNLYGTTATGGAGGAGVAFELTP
jgi:uncharacterized repeat protein (TIGR03803 family)